MAEPAGGPQALLRAVREAEAAAADAATDAAADAAETLARGAGERLAVVLDLIEAGDASREGRSGLNAASSELLIADALLTTASLRYATEGSVSGSALLPGLDLESLAARAERIDARNSQ